MKLYRSAFDVGSSPYSADDPPVIAEGVSSARSDVGIELMSDLSGEQSVDPALSLVQLKDLVIVDFIFEGESVHVNLLLALFVSLTLAELGTDTSSPAISLGSQRNL